ncbi:MAG: acyl-CoA thioesterase [Methylophilus sp.]|uniref:acyl-CoA thioesterase n=1 Tax=Methylophilus sp. TaxID=29541 RepID=UPI003FA07F7C
MHSANAIPVISATVEIEVAFHDVDQMHVVWHGHYVKYLEIARCALFRRFGYDYPDMTASGYLWPVVDCQLKYIKPVFYGDVLQVQATLVEYENRLKVAYQISHLHTGEKLTKASTTQVALEATTLELQFVSPPVLLEKIDLLCQQIKASGDPNTEEPNIEKPGNKS